METEAIMCEGYLEKRGSKFKLLKRRWMRLKEDRIEWFDCDKMTEKLGEMLIDASALLKNTEKVGKEKEFTLSTNDRKLKLVAASSEQKAEWIVALTQMANVSRKNNISSVHLARKRMSVDLGRGDIAAVRDACSILHAGWLEKRGRQVSFWKNRWLVLTSRSIRYYEDDKMQDLRGELLLDANTRMSKVKNLIPTQWR